MKTEGNDRHQKLRTFGKWLFAAVVIAFLQPVAFDVYGFLKRSASENWEVLSISLADTARRASTDSALQYVTIAFILYVSYFVFLFILRRKRGIRWSSLPSFWSFVDIFVFSYGGSYLFAIGINGLFGLPAADFRIGEDKWFIGVFLLFVAVLSVFRAIILLRKSTESDAG